jgi:hypothetical protein
MPSDRQCWYSPTSLQTGSVDKPNKPSDRQCWYSLTSLQTGSADTAQAFRQAILIQLNKPSDRQCWYSTTSLQTGNFDTAQQAFRQAVFIQLNMPSHSFSENHLARGDVCVRVFVCVFVRERERTLKFTKYFYNTTDRAFDQAISRLPVIAETLVQFYASPRGICGWQSGAVTGFSLSAFGFHYQLLFPNTPYSFIHNRRCVMLAVGSVV